MAVTTQAARAAREREEDLMENNPLEVVFETEQPSPRSDAMRVRACMYDVT